MYEDGLHQTITADASGASPAFQSVIDLASKLATELGVVAQKGTVSGDQITAGATKAAIALKESGAAGQSFGKEIESGAEQGIYALRVLRDTTFGLRDALLTLAGPVTAIFAIGEAFKAAVGASSAAASQFGEISLLLQNQGVQSAATRTEIEKYVEALSRASQFGKGEFLDGIRSMLAAGMSLNDSLRSQQAAMDLSLATGKSLSESEQNLAQAYNGRMRGLMALGLITKEEIKNGISYETILSRIEDRTKGGVSEANEHLTAQLGIMRNNFGLLLEDVGDKLSPALGVLAGDMTAGAVAVQGFIDGSSPLKDVLVDIGVGIENVVGGIVHLAESGPGAVAIIGALTIATGRLAVSLTTEVVVGLANATGGLVKMAATMVTTGIAAVTSFALSMSGALMNAIRTMTLAFIVEGPAAIGTLVATLAEGASSAVASFAVMAAPAVLVSAAIAGLALAWATDFGNIKEVTDTIITWIVNRFGDLLKAVAHALTFMGGIADHIPGMHGIAGGLKAAASGVGTLGTQAQTAKIHVDALVASAQKLVSGAFNAITAGFKGPGLPKPPHTDASTHVTPAAAGTAGGAGASPIDAEQVEKIEPVIAAEDKLKASLQKLTDEEVNYKNAVALSTTVKERDNAETALKKKVSDDAVQALKLISAQQKDEASDIARLTILHAQEKSALNDKIAAYNAALASGTASAKHLASLLKQEEEAKKAYDASSASLKTLGTQYEANARLIDHYTQTQIDAAAATANVALKADEASIALTQKNAEDLRHISDEENTYKKSISDQIAYYEQRLALIKSSGEDTYNETEKLTKQIESLELDAYKQRIDAAEAYKQAVEQKEKGLLDDVLVKHKSARDELKTVYDDIKTSYINMLEQMILKTTAMQGFGDLFSALTGGASSGQELGGKGKQKPALGGDIPGIDNSFAAIMGADGGTKKGPVGTQDDPVYIMGTSAHLSALTGSPHGLTTASDGSAIPVQPGGNVVVGGSSGGSPDDFTLPTGGATGSVDAAASAVGATIGLGSLLATGSMGGAGKSGTPSSASIFSALGVGSSGPTTGAGGAAPYGIGGAAQPAISKPTNPFAALMNQPISIGGQGESEAGSDLDPSNAEGDADAPTIGGAVGAAGQGMVIGSLISPMLDNGSNDAVPGGAVGGAAGMIAGTIIGGPVGGAVGSVVGAVIGSAVGGLFGSHTSAAKDPDIYDTQSYGQNTANLTGQTLEANGSQFSESYALSQSLGGVGEVGAVAKYMAATGGTGYTTAQLQELKGVTSINPDTLHNGNLTANNGETMSAAAWFSLYQTATQIAVEAGGVPSYTISNTLPNQGSITAQGQTVYPNVSSGSGLPSALRTGGSIVADFRGATIVGPGGLDTASLAISQSLQRAQNGQVAGTPSGALTNLRYGNII